MSNDSQYKHKDPNTPWKWMSSGNGGYRMYFQGNEITPDCLERFLNANFHDVNALIGYARDLVTAAVTKG